MNKYLCGHWRALAAALLITGLAGCGAQEPSQAYGTLEREPQHLTAPQAEMVSALLLTKGSKVSAGQPVVQLDTTAQQLRVNKATAELAKAQAFLQELTNGSRPETVQVATARTAEASAALSDAIRQQQRASQLASEKLLAQAALDSARLNQQVAAARLRVQQQQLAELQAGVRPEQISQASQQVDSARQTLALEQKLLADLTLRASRAGVVEDLPYQVGERVSGGTVLAVLSTANAAYARIYLPQPYLSTITLGQSLMLQADPNIRLHGTVRFIARQSVFTPYYALHKQERSQLMYLVEVQLHDADQLPTGLPLQLPLAQLSSATALTGASGGADE